MDFVHNPYRCGPLRVGRYALGPIQRGILFSLLVWPFN